MLVEVGTNNCNQGGTVPDAGRNVTALINKAFQQSPGATVILTTILANPDAKQDACRVNINQQYQTVAADFEKKGAKLVLVDMRGPDGPTVNDLADRRHPNDAGYAKMAKVWFGGVQQAQSKNFFTAAAAISATDAAADGTTDDAAPAPDATTSSYGSTASAVVTTSAQATTSSAASSRAQAAVALLALASGLLFVLL